MGVSIHVGPDAIADHEGLPDPAWMQQLTDARCARVRTPGRLRVHVVLDGDPSAGRSIAADDYPHSAEGLANLLIAVLGDARPPAIQDDGTGIG